ncbi:NB-ARC domain-containing protein [Streptomyces sp. NBC_00249]|uniref:AfsR/SARP family transcriptional regulator n=1 Tax=Streptomyces sp. NBC_00249 TaxID=2975690 RepID=UPI002251D329|nr:AfsR/SARP family transcriptional regulator [Streptomyces sp. NBC_00249]MCX5193824.1 NB-ARC domain-containing protein [Streptomyces sp. NBC_00249]
MDFRLLGPIEAKRGGGSTIPLSGSKVHTVLAALLLSEGRVVSDARLSALLWGWDPPATASAQIYTYMSRLRKHLGSEVEIVRRQPGYVLRAPEAWIDLTEFDRLDRQGREALADRRFEEAGTLLRDALELWRGTALANATEQMIEAELPRLEEARMIALESRIEADLAVGRHEQVTAELTGLVAEHPVRERLRAQLMTALYRCGRQADALHTYYEGRAVLADQLGVDPGEALGSTYQAVLGGGLGLGRGPASRATADDGAAAPAAPEPAPAAAKGPRPAPAAPVVRTAAAPAAGRGVPAMLPAPYGEFTGRREELRALRERLTREDGRPRRLLITGMAGAGKTALAVRAAQDCAARFPDGQLFVELCHPDGSAKEPAEVLVRLLRALGEPPPASAADDLEELVRLYRTRTSGARLLLVLDGAVGDRQVAPLLPGGPESAVLITSQARLARVAGADTTALALVEDEEALELLASLVGRARLEADPDAADDLVAYCAGLPLALHITGARLAARPHWPVSRLAARLADPDARLGELAYGDVSVREALVHSVRRLAGPELTALTGLADGDAEPFCAQYAALVLGIAEEEAESSLDELVDHALLELSGLDAQGRPLYRWNDLVRLLAGSLTTRDAFPSAMR